MNWYVRTRERENLRALRQILHQFRVLVSLGRTHDFRTLRVHKRWIKHAKAAPVCEIQLRSTVRL